MHGGSDEAVVRNSQRDAGSATLTKDLLGRGAKPPLRSGERTTCKPALSEHEQNRTGPAELRAAPFETFKRNIREQLARTLAGGSFDPARDITGITPFSSVGLAAGAGSFDFYFASAGSV